MTRLRQAGTPVPNVHSGTQSRVKPFLNNRSQSIRSQIPHPKSAPCPTSRLFAVSDAGGLFNVKHLHQLTCLVRTNLTQSLCLHWSFIYIICASQLCSEDFLRLRYFVRTNRYLSLLPTCRGLLDERRCRLCVGFRLEPKDCRELLPNHLSDKESHVDPGPRDGLGDGKP